MPLVDHNNDLLVFRLVDVMEQLFILLIYKHSFGSWEHEFKILDEPVHPILIEHCLCQCSDSMVGDDLSKCILFNVPSWRSSSEPLIKEVDPTESRFMIKSPSCLSIKLVSKEFELCSVIFCSFTSIFNFKSLSEGIVFKTYIKVPSHQFSCQIHSRIED